MWESLIVLAGFMLFFTAFGKQFGESLGTVGEGVSKLLSPKIQPRLVPTIGLEFTPGIWEWWQGAQKWISGFGPGPGPIIPPIIPPPVINGSIIPPIIPKLPIVFPLPNYLGTAIKPLGQESTNTIMRVW